MSTIPSTPSSMRFSLCTPEYNIIQDSVEKVRLHLTTGVLEILNRHQAFLGKIENNLIEITSENKKTFFLLKDAICYLYPDSVNGQTNVYIYGKTAREINSSISISKITEEYEKKKLEVDKESERLIEKFKESEKKQHTSPKLEVLKSDLRYFENLLIASKKLKESDFS